ncbi:MAG: hypothetical protein JXP34_26275 [Planctomycetes bacterium]|nr:hypothetical protein [Planctomycetota bacterium]
MDRNAHILRRDARAPLCVAPNPLWMFDDTFRGIVSRHLDALSPRDIEGVRWLAQHHFQAQEFVVAVDALIVDEHPARERARFSLATLFEIVKALASLAGGARAVDDLRERLAERMGEDADGRLPEFEWGKRGGSLYLSRLEAAGVPRLAAPAEFFVSLSEVYDDCARTLQFGYWVIGNDARIDVVDSWLFQATFSFVEHILPDHVFGRGANRGLRSLLPEVIASLPDA